MAGALAAALVIFIVFQGTTQEVKTQTEREDAAAEQLSFPAQSGREFVLGEVIVGLEEDAMQADLAALNRRNDARTEKDLPRSDVNLVDLPQGLSVQEAVQRYEASPDVDVPEAWNTSTGNLGTVVAVIDEGWTQTTRTSGNSIWTNPGEVPGNGLDSAGTRSGSPPRTPLVTP